MSSRFLKSRVTSNSIYPRNSRRTPWMHLAQQQYLEESQIIFGLFQNSDGSSTTRYFFFTLPCLTNIRGCVPLVEIKLWTKTILILRRSWILPVFKLQERPLEGSRQYCLQPLFISATAHCCSMNNTNIQTQTQNEHKHNLTQTLTRKKHTLRKRCCLYIYCSMYTHPV